MRAFVVVALLLWSSLACAQVPGVAVSGIVCGPGGVSGVTYATVGGQQVGCGQDSSGNALYVQVSTLQGGGGPVDGGEYAGLDIGAAVLGVMAVAWCFRALRNYVDSSGET